jgi:glycosyltransferase involved in cell wall biosynthesis
MSRPSSGSRTARPRWRCFATWPSSSRSTRPCRTSARSRGGARTRAEAISEGPLVSCIVPTFNAGRYLREALRSILDQTYRPIELVVADDGSADDTLSIAGACGDGVRVVAHRDQGPSATRNLGARAARGAFLAFLDPDDLWRRDKLERQMRCFREHPGLDLCVAHVQVFWEPTVAGEGERLQGHARASRPVAGFAATSLLVCRDAFERVGPFDSGLWFADGLDWFMRADAAGLRRRVLPDVLTYHRMHSANLTRRRDRESRDEFLRVVKTWADRSRGRDQRRAPEEPLGDARPQGPRSRPSTCGLAQASPEARVGDQERQGPPGAPGV